jgi:hypothetical protein
MVSMRESLCKLGVRESCAANRRPVEIIGRRQSLVEKKKTFRGDPNFINRRAMLLALLV